MKIVIDSNIFISSFFWGGNPSEVFERVINGFDELFITNEIINEIISVMIGNKFTVNNNEVDDYIEIIKKYSKNVDSKNETIILSRDQDDNKILQCAYDGNVDYIITGDKDLLVLSEFESIKILNPSDYLKMIRKVSIA